MSVAANQQRTVLRLLAELRPHWRHDPALPARIQALLGRHRSFGARDRRLYRELIYTALRHLPWIEPILDSEPDEATRRLAWLAADVPATHGFREAWATGAPPAGDKSELLPGWFRPHCPEIFSGAELEAQLRRAPVWLRLQTGGGTPVFDEFRRHGWEWQKSAVLENAIRLVSEADVTQSAAFKNGLIEVQDLGSQLVLASVGIEPDSRWLDACAGAGGKTLQLATTLGRGAIDAHDIRPAALAELERRVRRAESIAELSREATPSDSPLPPRTTIRVVDTPEGAYDGVLVDAPCSGSGTWRRAPHLKWITTPEIVARAAATQLALLSRFAAFVKPGGRLVYATCSLSSRENEDVANGFLAAHPEFEPEPLADRFGLLRRGPGRLILPGLHDTDGFFVASLRRRARP